MPDYVFVDGPLAGQATTLTGASLGDAILVEVVDFGDDLVTRPQFSYVVDGQATSVDVGHLRLDTAGGQGLRVPGGP